MRWAYLGLIAWQPLWHTLFVSRGLIGVLWMLPLLVVFYPVWRRRPAGRAVGGFVVLLYVITGITELWANPDERWLAAVQLTLCAAYLVPLMRHGWEVRRRLRHQGKNESGSSD